jgi:hypothetical protein
VSLRAVLDAVVKRKTPSLCRDWNPRSSSRENLELCNYVLFKEDAV